MSAAAAKPRYRARTRWWRLVRRAFLLLLLAAAAVFWWLDRVGFPEPARRWLQAQWRRHGWEAAAGPIRLQWPQGLVTSELALRRSSPTRLELSARAVRLCPDWKALLQGRLELVRLDLHSGRLTLAAEPETQTPEQVVFEQLEGRLETAGPGVWRLTDCRALVLGCRLTLEALITNRPPPVPSPRHPAAEGISPRIKPTSLDPGRWRELITWVHRLGLQPPPEVHLLLTGDTADPASFAATLELRAPAASWAGRRLGDLDLSLRLEAAGSSNAAPNLRLNASAAVVESTNLHASRLRLEAAAPLPEGGGWPGEARWHLETAEGASAPVAWESIQAAGTARWKGARPGQVIVEARGEARHVSADQAGLELLSFQGSVQFDSQATPSLRWDAEIAGRDLVVGRWGRFRQADLFAAGGSLPAETASELPDQAGAAGLPFQWSGMASLRLQEGELRGVALGEIELALDWQPPRLRLPLLAVRTSHGALQLRDGLLDVRTRRVEALVQSDADPHRLAPLGPEGVHRWLGQFTWQKAPRLEARAEATLPSWETAASDWAAHLLESVHLRGQVEGTNATYRGVPFRAARLQVALDGPTLRLRRMHLERPEGGVDLEYTLGLLSREFHWRFDCRLDPKAVAPAVDRHLVSILEPFEFRQAAWVHGDAWGTFRPPKRTDLALWIDAADFRFKQRPVDRLTSVLFLTNRVLVATNLQLAVEDQWARAERVVYEPERRYLQIHGGRAVLDPMLAAAWIGSGVERTLAPYRFGRPPEVGVQGSVFVGGTDPAAALVFDIQGGPFRFWRLGFPEVRGRVEWRGDRVLIRDVHGSFHGGSAKGNLEVTARPGEEPRVAFVTAVRQAQLPSLVQEVFAVTNRLEGRLDADLVVTNGLPSDWRSWCGHGRVSVQDGLLWDLPVMGVVSRALNAISPGLGNNQATAARGSFVLDRGVIRTSDTRIDCRTVQLEYAGACTLRGELDARVTVRLLGKTPVVGPFLGVLLAPVSRVFELSLRGRLGEPHVEFTHISPLTAPLTHPWKTLRRVFEPRPISPPPRAEPDRSERRAPPAGGG